MLSGRDDLTEGLTLLSNEPAAPDVEAAQLIYEENENNTLPLAVISYEVSQIIARRELSSAIHLAETSRLFRNGFNEAIQGYTARHLRDAIALSDCQSVARIVRSNPELLFKKMHRSSSNLHNIIIDPISAAFAAADIHMLSTLHQIIASEYPSYLITFLEEGEATPDHDHLDALRNAYRAYRKVTQQQKQQRITSPTAHVDAAWLAIGKAMRELPLWLLKEACRCRNTGTVHKIDLNNIPTTAEALFISKRCMQSILPLEKNKGLGYDYSLLFLSNWSFPKLKNSSTIKAYKSGGFDVTDDLKIFEEIYKQGKRMIKSMLEGIKQSPQIRITM